MHNRSSARRRDVLRAGLAGGALGMAGGADARASEAVVLVADPADPIASAAPVLWALGELRDALTDAGVAVRQVERLEQADRSALCIVACGAGSDVARLARVSVGEGAERLALQSARVSCRRVKIACGSDARGLMYALLELADRLRTGSGVADALALSAPIAEVPATPVRSVMRQVVSEPLDRSWFEDRAMWPHYLGMLANSRFNRLHLGFGLGYDSLRGVTDSYMLFLYPFLVDVPGYNVAVTNLSAAEREANLATLRFISDECAARGVDFQLGIWTHGYELIESPNARYHVTGLTRDTLAAYCRDAMTAVLRACPAISSVALRFHGESGIAEGNYNFWQTVYESVPACGRIVEIDLHAKGVDPEMIARARATGMPVNISEKCWAEHHGMAYHQADIRPSERPRAGQVGGGLLTLSEGALSFTRYGYADLLREDRDYTVRHRVFAGTQRLLLSGDPAWAKAYAQRFTFCGSDGFDLMEPLTARGRRGTGIAGTLRSGYADASLEPRYDWEKYRYWYRVWGRVTYNPETDPSVWRREFPSTPQASALVSALARASRILPIVTTAHMPSAACDAYWPEIYWNHAMVGEPLGNLYWDTPSPKDFQHVTAHDPQLFASIEEHAGEVLAGQWGAKYTPLEVAQWLDDLAASVEADLVAAGAANDVETRRLMIDVRILAGLGRFFAAKFRAGVLFAIHQHTMNGGALHEAIEQYRIARTAWAGLCEHARVYADDLSVSDKYSERRHWIEQLPSIDADIARLEKLPASAAGDARVSEAVRLALGAPRARSAPITHNPQVRFQRNQALSLSVAAAQGRAVTSVRCYYRHVNQAERWQDVEMVAEAGMHRCVIPAAYTDSPYPLQYYFASTEASGAIDLYPGLGPDLTDEPYFVVRAPRG